VQNVSTKLERQRSNSAAVTLRFRTLVKITIVN